MHGKLKENPKSRFPNTFFYICHSAAMLLFEAWKLRSIISSIFFLRKSISIVRDVYCVREKLQENPMSHFPDTNFVRLSLSRDAFVFNLEDGSLSASKNFTEKNHLNRFDTILVVSIVCVKN